MEEVWRKITGFEENYEISNFGKIKSLVRKRALKESIRKNYIDRDGYHQISLWKDGKGKFCKVHRLVAQAFIPNPENKPQINHINGIKNDNRVENLEWATDFQNKVHASENNLTPILFKKGESHPNSKLTEKDVISIRSREYTGYGHDTKLAKEFKVKTSTIRQIRVRDYWKHI
jgi:hypothetical protein